jgi:hypothetical protein
MKTAGKSLQATQDGLFSNEEERTVELSRNIFFGRPSGTWDGLRLTQR